MKNDCEYAHNKMIIFTVFKLVLAIINVTYFTFDSFMLFYRIILWFYV